MSESEVIEAAAREATVKERVDRKNESYPGTDLEPAVEANLFHADDPADVLPKATAVADALSPVLREKNMVTQIQGKEHVSVEGWQTLGAMLGVTPVTVSTTKLENGWEARVEARTLDGRVVGAADSMCTRDEGHWKSRDEFAIRSMAQTRATSRALASVLRFVVTLAGFSGTPAEEMGGGGDGPATDGQRKYVNSLFGQKQIPEEERVAIVTAVCGGDKLTKSGASEIIEALKEGKTETLRQVAGLTEDESVPVDDEGLDPEDLGAEAI